MFSPCFAILLLSLFLNCPIFPVNYCEESAVINFSSSASFTPALLLCVGRLRQRELCLFVFVGRWRTWSAIMASQLDDYRPLQHRLLAGVPRELRHTSAGVAVVGHLCVTEELPARTSRAVPSSCGSPRLRDG